jgi:hypothetical protein
MPGRGLLVAALLAALLAGGIWYSNRLEKDKESKPPDSSVKLLDIPEDQIQQIEIAKAGQAPVVMKRDAGGRWALTAPQPSAADSEAVTSMVSTLAGFSTDKLVEEKAADLNEFGLAQPQLAVTVTKEDGQSSRVLIGDETATGGGFYSKLASDARVFTVYSYNKASIDKSWNDLRDKRLLTFDEQKLTRVELTVGKQTLEFGKDGAGDWQILKPQPLRADNLQVQEIVRKLKEAKMDLSAPAGEAPQAAAFGSAVLVAVARATDSSGSQSIEVRKKGEDYFARSSAVEGIHKVTKELGEGLDKKLEDLRNKKLFDFGFNEPVRVEVRDGGVSSVLTKTGENWQRNGKNMDSPSVTQLVDKLRDLTALKFMDSGFTTPVMELSVTAGKKAEKVLVSKSGFYWIAKRDGEAALYELDGRAVEELQAAMKGLKEAAAAPKK